MKAPHLGYTCWAWAALACSTRADLRPGFGTPLGWTGELLVLGTLALGMVGGFVWLLRRLWGSRRGSSDPAPE